jgi:hypothetical protein
MHRSHKTDLGPYLSSASGTIGFGGNRVSFSLRFNRSTSSWGTSILNGFMLDSVILKLLDRIVIEEFQSVS